MESNKLRDLLFATPSLRALDVLLQQPDVAMSNTYVAQHVRSFKKSAINEGLRQLADVGLTTQSRHGQMQINRLESSSLVRTLQLLSNLVRLDPLVRALQSHCLKIVLFGSRALGTYQAESDFDLFAVSHDATAMYRAIQHSDLREDIQVVIKTPEALLTFQRDDPVFAAEVMKGITLWEAK